MRAITKTLLLGLCIGIVPSLHASPSFASGNNTAGTDANILCYSTSGSTSCAGSYFVAASAWSTTGTSGQLATAALGQWGSFGLGVCNDVERSSGSTCTSSPPEHAAGNVGYLDFILLTFSQPLTSVTLTLSTFNTTQDTDISYFTGNCTAVGGCSPLGKTVTGGTPTLGTSGFSSFYAAPANNADPLNGTRTVTLNLGGQSGVNWVLIGASTADTTPDDYFKLQGMGYTSGVPEPATFGLAGFALAAIAFLRRKKKASAIV